MSISVSFRSVWSVGLQRETLPTKIYNVCVCLCVYKHSHPLKHLFFYLKILLSSFYYLHSIYISFYHVVLEMKLRLAGLEVVVFTELFLKPQENLLPLPLLNITVVTPKHKQIRQGSESIKKKRTKSKCQLQIIKFLIWSPKI